MTWRSHFETRKLPPAPPLRSVVAVHPVPTSTCFQWLLYSLSPPTPWDAMAPNTRTGTDLVQTPSKAKKVKNEPDSDTKDPLPGSNGPNPALIAKFDQIAAEKGCTQWLMDHIEKQGKPEYLSYYDATYPPEKGVGYLTERDLETLKKEDGGSPCCLRLPQLALHPMSGNAGLVEAPTMRTLVLQVLDKRVSHRQ